MAANLRQLARKLQQAIAIRNNRRLSINQYQSYSTKAGRTVTKYVVSEYIAGDSCSKGKYKTLYETWNLPQLVKYLATVLDGEA
jgi:hypothetical protein